MSQVVASRYNEMATSEKYVGLGAPSLSNVNPSAHQAEVRRALVGDILKDYALQGVTDGAQFRSQVEQGMQNATPKLAIPTALQMQSSKASLGSGPKGPRSSKANGPAGAVPEKTLGRIRGIREGIINDEDSVRKAQGTINGAVETHR